MARLRCFPAVAALILSVLLAFTGPAAAQDSPLHGRSPAPLLDFVSDLSDCPAPSKEELAAINMTERRKIENPFQPDQDRWITNYRLWHYIGLGLTIASVVLGAIAASNLVADGERLKVKSFTALLATIVSASLGVLSPADNASRYLAGWIYMDSAITLYKTDRRVTDCHIGRAYAKAQSLVNKNIIGAALGAER